MKKLRVVTLATIVALSVASMAFALINGTTETGEQVLVLEASDILPNPDPCVCPHIYDPVVCGTFPDKKFFSNECVAFCAGYTNCAGVIVQPN